MSEVILILDDEPWQLTWLGDLARAAGWDPHFVESYSDAVAAYEECAPAVVVVDIRIGEDAPEPMGATLGGADPEWVGLRFVRHLRVEKKSRSDIFVYTGVDRDDLARTVEDAYQSRFFSKFDSREFSRALEARLKR